MRKFVCLVAAAPWVSTEASQVTLNPIRKVVNLLQAMQKKVQEEGEAEKELYEKFMCYCKTGGSDLGASISAAEEKGPSVSSSIEASEASLVQAKEDLKQAQGDRSAAKDSIAAATALREKEAAAYAAYKADADANTAAIAKAVASLKKGMAGGFLQTSGAALLRKAVGNAGLVEADQQEVLAFLSQSSAYAPSSGEITGILKQMGDTLTANLLDATKTEDEAIADFEGLVAAKKKEIAATTATVEAKTEQIGELGVSIAQMKNDLEDTQTALAEDKKFLAELKTSCATKTSEWTERSKTRSEELVALADTVKVLNDDDALELFKKTLPSPALLQVSVSTDAVRRRALALLQESSANSGDRPGLEFLALLLSGKKSAGGFDKVITMIDNMVAQLKKEQASDNDKKEYCSTQLDTADDKKKGLERSIEQTESAIATMKEGIATLTEEIAALETGIKALDKSVAEATEQRKEENTEFKALMASDTAAQEVLAFAKNRLNKFYNPKLYKAAPEATMSREDQIYSNEGGEVTTAAPGGIAGTGITVFAQVSAHEQHEEAPAPPPATWGAYAKKGGESGGVISMIDLLIKDLEKEMTEATTQEKDDQSDYEQLMKDSAEKRATDSATFTSKTAAKADLESSLQSAGEDSDAAGKELMATNQYIASLHAECDWLTKYFDVRKEARAGEIDSLGKAKAVLNGADYSLLQTRRQAFLSN